MIGKCGCIDVNYIWHFRILLPWNCPDCGFEVEWVEDDLI